MSEAEDTQLQPVRVAIVGSGFIAGEHAKVLLQISGVEIVGVVDVDPGRAAAFARTLGGVAVAHDVAVALAEWRPDAVVLCTPNGTHPQLAQQIAAAGAHALIEKPLAITPRDAAQLVTVFEERGLVLSAAHAHRFSQYAKAIKDVASGGTLGRPAHVRMTILGGWQWTDWRNWQIDAARSGGHALHNGVHLLDLATWWMDAEPVEVQALGRRESSSELDIYDYLLMTVGFADGQTAVCEMSRANRPRDLNYREVFLQGTAGSAHLPWDGETSLVISSSGTNRVAGTSPFADQAKAWIDAVRGLRPPEVTGRDGLTAVLLGTAAEQSLATGRSVAIADLRKELDHA